MSTSLPVLSDAEYFSIEDAISATTKGRAFLRQRDSIGRVVGVDAVGQIVRGLKDWIAGEESAPDRESLKIIRHELTSVRVYIDQVKSEITTLAVDEKNKSSRFRGATAELDEIVTSTARATDDILTGAEAIKELADALPEASIEARNAIAKHCMNMFEACSFQDITGQRIAKVVKTLNYVEERVNAMLAVGDAFFGAANDGAPAAIAHVLAAAPPTAPPPTLTRKELERDLLNGPQLPGHGLNQDAIDKMLTAVPPGAAPSVAPPVASNDGPLNQNAIDSLFG